ncbi:signal transducer [Paecilomyces variotii No. 5]|uniref:Signal transducer n=1 Tax=Byssochlamys spectabilis (strain No. 5 / NBRC 109023) TaxID=1356009 RepID=V5FT52_BYSSN|nr:signal transducer [Paecilomyces variotii No. 5]
MSDDETSRAGDQSSAEDNVPVETLVAGRARRSTAGNNLSTLLDAEADDELALLFAEDENDEEFESAVEEGAGEDADDMQLDSSSEDDDDQGPTAQDNDFEGEKELQKQDKADRLAKKRKAHESLKLAAIRKRVKIDTSTVSTPPSRPKKKSERISWLPTPEEGPTRSSSRRQTMKNKELTHARLKDSEEKRVRLIATMEEAAKRKEKHKPKQMTQEERLAEAARVERINSKSLNRWEEMEKKKAEEQRARLEALQNRRLEGPVMSWWSGLAVWVNGKLTRVGKVDIQQKPEKEEKEPKRKKKSEDKEKPDEKNKTDEQGKADGKENPQEKTQTEGKTNADDVMKVDSAEKEQDGPKESNVQQELANPQASKKTPDVPPAPASTEVAESASASQVNGPSTDKASAPSPKGPQDQVSTEEKEDSSVSQRQAGFLDGIHLYASMPEGSTTDDKQDPEHEPAPEPVQSLDAAEESSKDEAVPPIRSNTAEEQANTEKDEAQKPDERTATPAQSDSKAEETPQESSQPPRSPSQANVDVSSSDSKPAPVVSEAKPVEADAKAPQDSSAAEASAQLPQGVPEGSSEKQANPETVAPPPSAAQASPNASGQPDQNISVHVDTKDNADPNVANPPQPELPPVVENSGRNLIILENFDEKTAQSRDYNIYFNTKKPPRLTKISSHLCVITSLPARYKDPETGLPYANAYAYREIRRAVAQKHVWSTMLGCYVGPMGVAARGVPERFLDPTKPREKPKSATSDGTSKTDGAQEAETAKEKGKEKENEKANASSTNGEAPTPAPAPAATPVAAGDSMDVDK